MMLAASRTRILLLALALLAGGAFAEPPQSRQQALAQLATEDTAARLDALLRDDNPLVRDYAEQALWAIWSRSGNAAIDQLMARGVQQMEAQDYKAAIATFGDIIRRKPEFAEGWNKRATVYYLAGEDRKSIADCAEVLKRNPRHFGALSGLGLIYTRLGRYDEALAWLRKALDVNPNMVGVEMNIERIEQLLAEKRGKQI